MKRLFYNEAQRRLRSGWRLMLHFIFFALLAEFVVMAGALQSTHNILANVVYSALYLVGAVALVWVMGRFFDHRPFSDFGFHLTNAWWTDLGFGLVLGALLLTGIFLVERIAGWVTITGMATSDAGVPFGLAFIASLFMFVVVGINEELSFRGYQLKNLAEGLNGGRMPQRAVILALLLSSVFFGLSHLLNPDASALSTLNIVLWGLLAGLAYLLTGELAISIGLHITWNFFEGTVYGFPVSGFTFPTRLLASQQTGPELWTDGAFGPEAGLLAVLFILAGCGVIVLWVRFAHKHVALDTRLAEYTSGDAHA